MALNVSSFFLACFDTAQYVIQYDDVVSPNSTSQSCGYTYALDGVIDLYTCLDNALISFKILHSFAFVCN